MVSFVVTNDSLIAGSFAIGGCFIIISLAFAFAAGMYFAAGAIGEFLMTIIVAAFIGMVGFYNAFRAYQNQSTSGNSTGN